MYCSGKKVDIKFFTATYFKIMAIESFEKSTSIFRENNKNEKVDLHDT